MISSPKLPLGKVLKYAVLLTSLIIIAFLCGVIWFGQELSHQTIPARTFATPVIKKNRGAAKPAKKTNLDQKVAVSVPPPPSEETPKSAITADTSEKDDAIAGIREMVDRANYVQTLVEDSGLFAPCRSMCNEYRFTWNKSQDKTFNSALEFLEENGEQAFEDPGFNFYLLFSHYVIRDLTPTPFFKIFAEPGRFGSTFRIANEIATTFPSWLMSFTKNLPNIRRKMKLMGELKKAADACRAQKSTAAQAENLCAGIVSEMKAR